MVFLAPGPAMQWRPSGAIRAFLPALGSTTNFSKSWITNSSAVTKCKVLRPCVCPPRPRKLPLPAISDERGYSTSAGQTGLPNVEPATKHKQPSEAALASWNIGRRCLIRIEHHPSPRRSSGGQRLPFTLEEGRITGLTGPNGPQDHRLQYDRGFHRRPAAASSFTIRMSLATRLSASSIWELSDLPD